MRYLLSLILLYVSVESFGQFSYGVKAGLNINDIAFSDLPMDLEDYADASVGFHLGVYGKIKMSEKFSLIPELQFSQKGAKYDWDIEKLNLNYLELPLLVSYAPVKWIGIDLGPSLSYKISSSARLDGSSIDMDDVYEKDLDFGLTAGLRVPVLDRFAMIGRYYLGLAPIDEIHYRDINGFTTVTKEYNRTIQLGLSYRLK